MSGEQIDFRKLLESLRRQKSAIEQMIAGAEAFLGEAGLQTNGNSLTQIQPDTFIGKTIVESTAMFLRMVGRPPRTTEQIVDALNSGGLPSSKESVAALLMRDSNQGGEIYRVGRGVWGLSEWYPGAIRRGKKKATDKEGDNEEPSKEEQAQAAPKEDSSDAA